MKLEQNCNFHIYPTKDKIFQTLATVFLHTRKKKKKQSLWRLLSKHEKIKFKVLYLDSNCIGSKTVRIKKKKVK